MYGAWPKGGGGEANCLAVELLRGGGGGNDALRGGGGGSPAG